MLLLIVAVLGIGGGASIASIAGARTTASAYPRFLEDAHAPDLIVDSDFANADQFLEKVDRLPGVIGRSDAAAVSVGQVVDGVPIRSGPGLALASVDGRRFYAADRVHVIEGRLPAPQRANEVLVNKRVAEGQGVAVGDSLDLTSVPVGSVEAFVTDGSLVTGSPLHLTVTGIGVFPEEVVVEEEYAEPKLLLTPALYDHLGPDYVLYRRSGLDLEPDADVVALRRAIDELATDFGEGVIFEERSDITGRTQRAARPYSLALLAVGLAVAVFVVLLASQITARVVATSSADAAVLRAIAFRPVHVVVALATGPCLAAVGAAFVAGSMAIALSPLAPVGQVRAVVDPGRRTVDRMVVLAGCGLIVLLGSIAAILSAAGARRRHPGPRFLSDRLLRWLVLVNAPHAATIGIRQAIGRGGPDRTGSPRAGILGTGVAVTCLAAAACFGASAQHLLDRPATHGWAFDAVVYASGGYGSVDQDALVQVQGVDDVTLAVFGGIDLDGIEVPGMGLIALTGDVVLPTQLEGRPPTSASEIVVGAHTLSDIGAKVGDSVDMVVPDGGEGQPEPQRVTIVGTAVFPGLGIEDGDRPTLGRGVLILLGSDQIHPVFGVSTAFVRFARDADRAAVVAQLQRQFESEETDTQVFTLFRPADIASFADLGATPWALGVVLGGLALVSLAHGLLASNRASRRERAVLAALGCRPRDLARFGHWQAMTLAAAALLVGMPLGVAAGRQLWASLATDVGISPDPSAPILVLLALAVLLIAAALLVGHWQTRTAAQLPPAAGLRTE